MFYIKLACSHIPNLSMPIFSPKGRKILMLILAATIMSCSSSQTTGSKPVVEPKDQITPSNESIKTELALYQKAVLTINDKKLDEAEKLFMEMSELQPDMAGSWANLAIIKMKQGDLKASQAMVDMALDKNPSMPQALNLAGDLALKAGKLSDAKNYFVQALQQKPDYAIAHYNLALLYDIYFQDLPQAITHYQLYLDYLGEEDKDTSRWLKGLKSTVGAS